MLDLIDKEESYGSIGPCFDGYNKSRNGFVAPVYHESLILECGFRKLPAVSEPQLRVNYKREPLKETGKPDFVSFSKIVLEIKAIKDPTDEYRAQVLNCLKVLSFKLGLLVNFGSKDELQYERIVL